MELCKDAHYMPEYTTSTLEYTRICHGTLEYDMNILPLSSISDPYGGPRSYFRYRDEVPKSIDFGVQREIHFGEF